MDFGSFPIAAGAIFGTFFLICCVVTICCKHRARSHRPQYVNTTPLGPNTVANINAQFNNPIPTSGPYQSFAPTGIFPQELGHPQPYDHSHHFQYPQDNFNNGPVNAFTPPPMVPTDAPPSYSEVIASS